MSDILEPCAIDDEHRPLGAMLPEGHLTAFADMPLFEADPAIAIPASWALAGTSAVPVLDQGSLPWCEIFTDDELIGWFDTQASRHYRAIDRATAYRAAQRIDGIPGTHDGTTDVAALTVAKAGISYVDRSGKGAIGGWTVVSANVDAIKAAMVTTGHPVPFSVKWPHSWFHLLPGAVAPKPDYQAGGHRLMGIVRWVPGRVRIRQSWGTAWGDGGEFWVNDADLDAVLWGAQVVAPPPVAPKPLAHRLHIAKGATVHSTTLDAQSRLVLPWTVSAPFVRASSAPCSAPVNRIAADGTPAHVALVSAGMFRGKWVHVATGDGTSVTEG